MFIKEIITYEDRQKYSNLAMGVGNIFNSLEWLDTFGKKIKVFGVFQNKEEIIAGFYLYKENKFGLTFYQNPPFTPCIGPIFKIKPQNRSSVSGTRSKSCTRTKRA